MNWIDIAIIGIICLNLLLGWYKGLIRSVVNLVSIVLAFMGAKFYHATMAGLLDDRFDLLFKLKKTIGETFTNVNFTYDESLSNAQVTDQLTDAPYLKSFMDKFFSSDKFEGLMEKTTEGFSASFSDWAANHLLNIIGMVVVFLGIYVAIRVAGYILAKIFDAPVLKGVNKLSGLIFGGAKGIFFAMLFVLGLVVASPFLDQTSLMTSLESSYLGMILYKYNIILLVFQYFI